MSALKSLELCLIGLFLFHLSSCEQYKNSQLSPGSTSFSSELTKHRSIDHVHIDYENISTITKDFLWRLTMVKKLEIEHSNVRTIEKGAFQTLYFLRKLNLKHNLLEEITDGIFNMTFITELDLSDNQIRTIHPDAFKWMFLLRSISLKNNKLEVFNNHWFANISLLSNVNFENNLIKALPERVVQGRYYWGFGIDIIFSHNRIEEIDENAFKYISNVRRLYLDHNNLANIENETFSRAAAIDELRLDHNNIVCITVNLGTVRKLNVEGNPWNQKCLLALNGQIIEETTTSVPVTVNPFMFRGIG